MATAVKNNPETTTPSLFDRPAAISLVGVVYVVGSLGIVFKLLPYLFWDVLHFPADSPAANIGVALLLVAAATGLLILGLRLLGPRAAHGTRAGIFVGVLGVLAILLITRWASLWLEKLSFHDNWFGPLVGAGITAALGIGLLVAGGYYFLQPWFEKYLQQFEDQGWFSATTFKSQQGQKVRRGTILGILLLVVPGIYLLWQGPLNRMPVNWGISIPFTTRVEINTANFEADPAGEFRLKKLREKFGDAPILSVDAYALRDFNNELAKYVLVEDVGSATELDYYEVVEKSKFDTITEQLRSESRTEPKAIPLDPIYYNPRVQDGEVIRQTSQTIQLLPSIQYTLPILLLGVAMWGAWRIVHYPMFADFLIATEAELNKVSWTTRKKLVQDTIVVLVTVFLMTVYLFAMDQAWSHLLSWQPVRILQLPKDTPESAKSVDTKPW